MKWRVFCDTVYGVLLIQVRADIHIYQRAADQVSRPIHDHCVSDYSYLLFIVWLGGLGSLVDMNVSAHLYQ